MKIREYWDDNVRKYIRGNVLALLTALMILVTPAMAGEKSDAGQKGFLWKVVSKSATVYILGSIHLARAEIYPLPPIMEECFDRSAVLALEADPAKAKDETLLQSMLAAALYPEGGRLGEHLSKETYDQAEQEMKRLGLPMEFFSRTRPWFLAMTMETMELKQLGFDPAHGIDIHFAGKAAGKKRIIELESFDFQIRLLNGFTDREQELFLLYTLKDISKLKDVVEELMAAWRSGDAKGMEALVTRSLIESPELWPIFDKLFYRRNLEMSRRVEGLLQGKETVFVVIGAAHLVGREGIIELLRGKGYKIEQM